ncbi:MAG: hypothetical protein IKQ72_01800 [Bacteroidaceae bacterium]|nr:hypothetical protein [Bacteroidaceae bacterium]
MKKLFGMLMLASTCCGNTYADDVNVGEGGCFLRTNVGTTLAPEYKYLEAGGETWGTAAVVGKHGLELSLEKIKDNTYNIASVAFNNNATSFVYFDGAYFDRGHDESENVFSAVKDGSETIGYKIWASKGIGGAGYLTLDSDGKTINKATNSNNAIVWEIVSKADRMKELNNATPNYPEDATFLIHDHGFSRRNLDNTYWCINSDENKLGKSASNATVVDGVSYYIGLSGSPTVRNNNYDLNLEIKGSGNTTNPYRIYQKVSELPKGKYRLSVYGFSSVANGAALYIKDGNGLLASTTFTAGVTGISDGVDAAKLFNESEQYKKSVEFVVSTDDVVIGITGSLKKNEKAYIDNFELTYYGAEEEPYLSLADDKDNSKEISDADGKVSTATLSGRTINVGGYNTLSVPFSVSKDAIDKTLGEGNWSLKALSDVNVKDGDITLVFADAYSIEAGKPYLVSVAKAVSEPTFHHVMVDAKANSTIDFDNGISFVPVLNYSTIGKEGDEVESMIFLGANNTLYYPLAMPAQMKGGRAYFYVSDPSILQNVSRRISFDFNSETTSIDIVRHNAESDGAWYTVNGTKLAGEPTRAGLYINNGKKIIIK